MAEKSQGKTPIDQFVIEKVKLMRHARNMSQAVLATQLNVAYSFIEAIENPKQRAKYNLTHINKLAGIFECSPRDFLPEKPL
jgi:transcriptional regulator with XRE-family HTH domain